MADIYEAYYNKKLFTIKQLARFVTSGAITEERFLEITGKNYIPEEVTSVITEMQTDILKLTAASNFTVKLIDKKVDNLAVKVEGGTV